MKIQVVNSASYATNFREFKHACGSMQSSLRVDYQIAENGAVSVRVTVVRSSSCTVIQKQKLTLLRERGIPLPFLTSSGLSISPFQKWVKESEMRNSVFAQTRNDKSTSEA